MRFFFIGSMIPKEISVSVLCNSEAANNFQWSIIKELEKQNKLELLNYIGYKTNEAAKVRDYCKKYNIICFFKENGVVKSLLSNFITTWNKIINCDLMIQYNVSYSNIFVPFIAHFYKKKCCLILADYTESVEYKDVFKKLYAKITLKVFKKFDKIICLSSIMAQKLRGYNKDVMVIEGGINLDEFEFIDKPSIIPDKPIIIMYSGLLSPITGVDLLLKAIEKLKRQDIEVWICGKGELQEEVIKFEKKDERLRYMGFVEREEYLKLLSKTHILINPRNMNFIQNKNNFPSKIMEYLASGRVILSTRFPNWGLFSENIVFIDSDELAIGINNIVDQYEDIFEQYYNKNRLKSKQFCWEKQVERINSFIKS